MRNEVYHFFVEGEPKAQPRPRKGKYGNFYNPGSADSWKDALQSTVLMQKKKPVIAGPVLVTLCFLFHKAGIAGERRHTATPDIDNLQKSTLDALTAMRLWRDDALVYSVSARKLWTSGPSGAEVWIEDVDGDVL